MTSPSPKRPLFSTSCHVGHLRYPSRPRFAPMSALVVALNYDGLVREPQGPVPAVVPAGGAGPKLSGPLEAGRPSWWVFERATPRSHSPPPSCNLNRPTVRGRDLMDLRNGFSRVWCGSAPMAGPCTVLVGDPRGPMRRAI